MSSVTLVRYYERQSVRRRITLAFVYLALVAGAVVILAPFVWMLSTALKVPGTEFIYPPQLFTRPLRWNNFSEGWGALPFTRWFLNSMDKMTLSLGLRFFQAQDFTDWTRLMAVSIVVLVPSLVLFFVAQKYYIHGVVTTGIKG